MFDADAETEYKGEQSLTRRFWVFEKRITDDPDDSAEVELLKKKGPSHWKCGEGPVRKETRGKAEVNHAREGVEKIWTEGLILAQGKRWRRALHMQVERELLTGKLRLERRGGKWRTGE